MMAIHETSARANASPISRANHTESESCRPRASSKILQALNQALLITRGLKLTENTKYGTKPISVLPLGRVGYLPAKMYLVLEAKEGRSAAVRPCYSGYPSVETDFGSPEACVRA